MIYSSGSLISACDINMVESRNYIFRLNRSADDRTCVLLSFQWSALLCFNIKDLNYVLRLFHDYIFELVKMK